MATMVTTSPDFYALSRLAFGANPSSAAELAQEGLRTWLDKQLRPDDAADVECNQRLANLRLRIKYGENKDWPALDELRPLQWLDAPLEKAWTSLGQPPKPLAHQERIRPRIEVAIATVLRAVYSRWQLREVLCDFWHNHFNVNAFDVNVGVGLPHLDREIIRRHCFGNFRTMLEDVGRSPAMLWYLNNRSSRTGAPNENYVRELFELHTLGRDAYLNGLYNRWRDVPGANKGKPAGYIDQDVYEAARALTGWAVEDGSGLGGGQSLPKTGKFTYVESWHDNYQKRVLGVEFDPYQPPLADGRKVLDLAAYHPATALFLSKKLCQRLVADQIPDSLLNSTAKVFMEHRNSSDQMARVIAHIVLSKEFARTRYAKVKRPLELVASFVRAIGGLGHDFSPTEGLLNEMDAAGQRLFGWPTPTGHPDMASHWLSANGMRRRWNLLAGLTENWWGTGAFDPMASATLAKLNNAQFTEQWTTRLYGEARPELAAELLKAGNLNPTQPMNQAAMARRVVAWAGMAPDFQVR